jgi:PEP-CTERM motif
MSLQLKDLLLKGSVALVAMTPWLASAQCQPGQPNCDVPEPGSWALVALAVAVAGIVMHRRHK